MVYHDLYPGIDLAYYGTQGQLEDDYTLAPGADPGAIGLGVTGAIAVRLAGDRLALDTTQGPVVAQAPVAYQDINGQRQAVSARYTLDGVGRVGFALGVYDHSRPVTIDPVLAYSTYLGGNADDEGDAIAVDGQGDVYVAGYANQTPIAVVNAAQSAPGGGGDAFVVKLNPAGNAAVYATYLGGSGYDSAYGIALDRANDADVTGNTTSTTFPTTANTPQRTYGDGQGSYGDVFVTELAPTGERAGLQHLPGRRAGRDATTRSAASARSTALAPCGERYGSSGAAAPTRD